MSNTSKINELYIGSFRYHITQHKDGRIEFYRVEREVTDDFEIVDVYDDTETNDTENALRTIRVIAEEIKSWIHRTHPPYVFFRANDARKLKIYQRLFDKNIAEFPDYNYQCYDGEFHMYRIHK